jgi:peptide-methionine (S)-S-oxide reductase
MRVLGYIGVAGGMALLALGVGAQSGAAAETFVRAPTPKISSPPSVKTEVAVFAGGCFWGVEGVFDHVAGVKSATSGYTGGSRASADYDQVTSGRTGHAEAVRVVFDPAKVRYSDLLRIYFSVVADPTRLNAQGPDHGTQYRTALFPQSATQERTARAYIRQLAVAKTFTRPIVTGIERASAFYPAEAYHQNFMARNPGYPYVVVNDAPKVIALKRFYPQHYRP